MLNKRALAVLVPVLTAAVVALLRTSIANFDILSTVGFSPHRYCLVDQNLVWTMAIADQITAICYVFIPVQLIRIFRHGIVVNPADKDKLTGAAGLLGWFAAFILSCGLGHQIQVITLWVPYYYLDACMRCATAVASTGTCVVLYQRVPQLMGLATTADLLLQVQKLAIQVRHLTEAARTISDKSSPGA